MKKTIIALAVLLAAGSATFAQDSTHKSGTHEHKTTASKKYTCTMHPEVVKNKPGKCPKCGMTLVPVKKKTAKKEKSMSDMKM